MKRIHEQMEFRPELPVIIGNIDYQNFKGLLIRIDELLIESGLEEMFVEEQLLKRFRFMVPGTRAQERFQKRCRIALRCNIVRWLTEKEYRRFSRRLADSPLLQWFCRIDRMDQINVPSKSELCRFDKMATAKEVTKLMDELNRYALRKDNPIGLENELDLDAYFSDSTCLKANIHFPVDWILLRDGVLTIIKSLEVIRKHGIRLRMPKPSIFLSIINKLSIEMSQSRRKKNAKKRRKQTLRKMKKITKTVREHALRYMKKIEGNWKKSDLSEGQKNQIIKRLKNVIDQIPTAIKQAHERIIGERKVINKDKILSLYEPDIHVIVRGKVNAETEFGNNLFLAEQSNGLIVDWRLEKEKSIGDIALMQNSIERLKKVFDKYPSSIGGDRGFWSQKNTEWLSERKIFNGICPKSPKELEQKIKKPRVKKLLKRRAQTEPRISIIKNHFLKSPLKNKGFEYRELSVAWAILSHNLWLLAGLPKQNEKVRKKAA